MTKEDILIELKKAKIAHISWHAQGQALSLGIESCTCKIPMSHHDCEFGKWYYSTGQLLGFTRNFSTIEEIHMKLHSVYNEIYTMCTNDTKKGIFSSKKSVKAKKSLELTKLVNMLKKISKSLLSEISGMEKQLNKMNPKKIASCIMAKDYQYIY